MGCDDHVVAPSAGAKPSVRRLAASGILLGALVTLNLWLGIGSDSRPRLFLASDVITPACFAIAGAVAWRLRPRSRIGPMMLLLGAVMLSANPDGFQLRAGTPGREVILFLADPAYWLEWALAAQILLSYPSGRLARGTPERHLIVACYLLAILGSMSLVSARTITGSGLGFYQELRTGIMVAWIGLAIIAMGLLISRLVWSTARQRSRDVFGLVTAISAISFFAVLFITIVAVNDPGANGTGAASLQSGLMWTGFIAIPVAFFIGLLRERLDFAAVGDLVARLEDVGADRVEEALRQTLHDPTLQVAFPTAGGLLDVQGQRYDLPHDGDRTLTPLGEPPVAVVMHDRALAERSELLDAAAAAARLALDNARLYAEVRAQLAEVQASRQRIAAAADKERQRLERDLHDGAQQRLLGIGFMLGALGTRLNEPADREMVNELEHELRLAIAELRDFAHGIRPAVLTDQGLGPALAGLVRRSQVRVSLDVHLSERLDPVIESTAYYVVSEALQNIAKHTDDARASVVASRENGRLIVEVSDDGSGGASVQSGTGLRGLTDRVGAVGGALEVNSPPGGGTRVRAEMPCA
jgi:signal transduction histidine kinase